VDARDAVSPESMLAWSRLCWRQPRRAQTHAARVSVAHSAAQSLEICRQARPSWSWRRSTPKRAQPWARVTYAALHDRDAGAGRKPRLEAIIFGHRPPSRRIAAVGRQSIREELLDCDVPWWADWLTSRCGRTIRDSVATAGPRRRRGQILLLENTRRLQIPDARAVDGQAADLRSWAEPLARLGEQFARRSRGHYVKRLSAGSPRQLHTIMPAAMSALPSANSWRKNSTAACSLPGRAVGRLQRLKIDKLDDLEE